MDLSINETITIAKKIKKFAIIDYIVIFLHYISFILFLCLFIDLNNISTLAGFGLQFIILLPILSIIKYISDVQISKLFKKISDKFPDKETNVLWFSSRTSSLKSLWLKFDGKFYFWIGLLSIHRIFSLWKLNNYIFRGSKQILIK